LREGCRLRVSVRSAEENIRPKRQKVPGAGENHILGNIIVVLLAKCYWDDQVKDSKMGGAFIHSFIYFKIP
jgi:hypothetical protein